MRDDPRRSPTDSLQQQQTPPEAEFKTLSQVAEHGDADAQFKVGVTYTLGRDALQDDAHALVWYRKAAEQGHAGA